MTIGDLREKLAGYPDFYEVTIGCAEDSYLDIQGVSSAHCVVFLETDFVADVREKA